MNFETTEKIDFYLPKVKKFINEHVLPIELKISCLLYTSDAADE